MTDCKRTGKVRYSTKQEALQAMRKIRKRIKRTKTTRRFWESHPHRCRFCLGWHLTSTPKEINDRHSHPISGPSTELE